jgi:phospholipid/cholesterol/gamma-HCH transport system substrate-binding protein
MKNKNLSVGIFVVGGLALFGAGMFLIGDRRQAFAQHVEYFSEFVNIGGLPIGAKVRVGGMDAGEVTEIGVPRSPSSRFRVRWRIGASVSGLIRADSVATIDTEGVVGGTFLAVRTGSSRAAQAAPLATIPSREPIELSELLTRGTGLLNQADTVLGQAGNTLNVLTATVSSVNDITSGIKQGHGTAGMLLRDDTLADQLRQSLTATASNVNELVAGIKAGRGAAGMLLRDEAAAGQIRDALKNAQQATADLSHTSRQAGALIADLAAQHVPQKVSAIMDSVGSTAKQVNQIVAEIGAPDRQGLTVGASIRDAVTNANAAALNLADDSEALKHNFLLRGFFRSRGYFNLDRISPEQYRRDPAFTSRANYRAWLASADLFLDGEGQEDLSAAGRQLLENAVTENGDAIFESPIVIEGYCNGRSPADQLRLSRARAILVRQYLQSRFQLDSSNLGIVAMKNTPPNGLERKSFDGICVVVLKKKSK